MNKDTLMRQARYEHKCCVCNKHIEAGSMYLDTFWKDKNGAWMHSRKHITCPCTIKELEKTTETKLFEYLQEGGSFFLSTKLGDKVLISGIWYDNKGIPYAVIGYHEYLMGMKELSRLYTETGTLFGGKNE